MFLSRRQYHDQIFILKTSFGCCVGDGYRNKSRSGNTNEEVIHQAEISRDRRDEEMDKFQLQ